MPTPKGFLIVPVGFRADGTLRALELTDSDELKVALSTATGSDLLTELESKLETADLELVSKILSIGSHGWIASAWQRNPLLFGFSGTKHIQWADTSLPGTNTNTDSAAVPAGEIWVITNWAIYYLGTPPTSIKAMIVATAGTPEIFDQVPPVSGVWYDRQGWWVLGEDDKLRVRVIGPTAGDQLLGRATGFRVDIDQ